MPLTTDQTVLITGASSGIGRELAIVFAKNHFNLILVARSGHALEQLRSEIINPYISVTVIDMDLAVVGAAERLYEQITALDISIDILINNAGFGLTGDFEQLDLAQQLEMIQLNVVTLTTLTHLCLPDMIRRNYGRIVNVGSIVSFSSTPAMAVYAATKAFILSLTEALYVELKQKGNITVTALCPGPTKTGFAARANIGKLSAWFNRYGMTAQDVARIGYYGMLRRKAIVVPGMTNKLLLAVLAIIPRPLLRKGMASILSKMN